MKGYELYIFILCLIVFVLLTTLLTVLIAWIVRLMIKAIRGGLEDEKIKEEYYKSQCRCGTNCLSGIFDKIISVLFCIIFFGAFIFALSLSLAEEKKVGDVPILRVVQSGSMSKKDAKNQYLFDNDLNDQIQTFDIIVTEKLPDEMDLELYDIVVYEVDDVLVVHRIIAIQEPNEKHPDCRWFTLQGDNVQFPDKTPVLYSQMRAIYNGERIPYIGSFIAFMQSPAGYLCVLLIVFGSIAIPIVERILAREREKRLIAIGELPGENMLLSVWQPAEADKAKENTTETPPVTPEPVQPVVEKVVEMKVVEKTMEKQVATQSEQKAVEKAQESKTETVKLALNAKALDSKIKEFEKSTYERNTYDWFYDSLTRTERYEFIKLFVFKEIGTSIKLPKYVIGGDNYVFFRTFFAHYSTFKPRVSAELLKKMYNYCVKKYRNH